MDFVRRLGKALLAFARRVGQAQAVILLSVFYVVFLAPVAVIFKCVADPLRLRKAKRAGSVWYAKSQPRDPWQWAKAQS